MKTNALLILFFFLSYHSFSQCAFTINANDPSYCSALNGGTITVNVTGGIAPLTYQLNNGVPQAGNIFNNVTAGTYTVYVTDATPCTDSVIVTGIAYPSPSLSILATTPVSCVPGCDGTTTTQTMGGAGGYMYSISGGAAINAQGDAANLCAGPVYTIVCTDANTCQTSTTIQLAAPAGPNININTITPPSCVPGCDATVTTITGGGQPVYTYSISGGATINAMGAAANICGGVVYTITVVDANACSGTTTVQVMPPPAMSVTVSNITNASCNGNCDGSAQLIVTGGVAPFIYMVFPMGQQNMTGIFNGLCLGTYTAMATDANGCSVTTTLSISQPPPIYFTNAAGTNPTCTGVTDGIINVSAANGIGMVSYTISPLAGNQNPTGQFNNLPTGNYIITASDANTCSATTLVNLTQPVLMFTVNTINNLSCTCSGSVNIQNIAGGVAPFAYVINPVVNQPIPGTFDNMCGGVYTVTVTDANNCTGTSIIHFNQIQLSSTGTNSQCNGVNNATITCTALYGTAPYTFTLNPGNIVNASGNFSNLAAGVYTISVTDAGLCSNTITVTRTNNTQISINLISSDSVKCGVGGGAAFSANGNAPGPYTYTVMPGNITNGIGAFSNLSAGNYTLTVSNAAGCESDSPFDVVQVSGLLPTAITQNVFDESCELSVDGAINIIPANPAGLSYLWSTGAVTQDLSNLTSGNYDLKITDINGDCKLMNSTVGIAGINCGTISGRVYLDSNSSCTEDPGDYPIPNVHISLSNGALAITNANGDYKFLSVGYGTYTITQTPTPAYIENHCVQPASVTVNAANMNVMNVDFKDSSLAQVDAEVFISSSNIAPGFSAVYYTTVFNNSGSSITGNLSFKNINNLIFNFAVPVSQGVYPLANGDSIVWTGITLAPYSSAVYAISYLVPANLQLGTPVTSIAKIDVTNLPDVNLNNNVFVHQPIAMGAWDPNDKSVNPPGEGPNGNITLQDSMLNYLIRFQNTGTDSAHNIFIMDTLSDKLDIATLKITGFSHPYKIEIINNHILKFKFDHIMLPDSNINEPLSHGYIAYSIEQKNNIQVGDVINNTASIYFDFNLPVVTNTTINTIVAPALFNSYSTDKTMCIYPNPATQKLYLQFEGDAGQTVTVSLINTTGQMIKEWKVNTSEGKNNIGLSLNNIPKGLYMLKLNKKDHEMHRKLIIE